MTKMMLIKIMERKSFMKIISMTASSFSKVFLKIM
jgi:hypothetical protein